jgi:hypothetical protein
MTIYKGKKPLNPSYTRFRDISLTCNPKTSIEQHEIQVFEHRYDRGSSRACRIHQQQ